MGPTGPQGIVGSTFAGAFTIIGKPDSTTSFLGPTLTFSGVTSTQKIFVSAQQALGAGASAASSLYLYICYQKVSSGVTSPVTTFGGGLFNLSLPANTRIPFGLSATLQVGPADSVTVGICGDTTSPNWTNNEWGYVSAILMN